MATTSAQLGGSSWKSKENNAFNTQEAIGNNQKDFMSTLQQDYGKAFAGQQNILNGLTKSLTQTLQAGPSQFGFSAPEVTALNTLATSSNAQSYQNARAAAGAALAAQGGAAVIPTGANAGVDAALAQESGQNLSNQLLGIQEAGYRQGTANYNESVSGLTSAASLENPQGLAGQATNAGEAAANTAGTVYQEAQANNPMNQLGALAGSVAGAALNYFAPGAGSAVSGLSGLTRTMGQGAPVLGGIGSQVGSPDSLYGALNLSQGLGSSSLPKFP